MKHPRLAGLCGVYCGACTTLRAYVDKDQSLLRWETEHGMPPKDIICEGCGSDLMNEWCANCAFRKCVKEKGIDFCTGCDEFPCKRLSDFSKTRPHRILGMSNLKKIREGLDMEEWLLHEEKRWSCPGCGKKLHWYSGECPDCGKKFMSAEEEVLNTR